jgi:5,10-methenyltetrahydromethanopterin hydrogenase
VDYYDNGYDINTMIDTIYVNAAKTHAGVIPTEHFQQMSEEGHKIWASLSDDD